MRLKIMCGILLILVIVGMLSPCFVVYAGNFNVGDTVEVINCTYYGKQLVVRDTPGGNPIGGRNDGDRGTVLAGPQSAYYNGTLFIWWKIHWQKDSLEGWSAEGYPGGVDYLKKVYLSDLIVEDIWIQPDPPSSGALTTWWFRIRNQGVGDASGTFFLECYFDNAYVGHAYVNGLLAGSTYTTYWSAMTWPSDANPHVIKGVVDPDNTIIESNEANNIRSEVFQASTPINQPPSLNNGYVTPPSGDATTTFSYYVTYMDPEGDVPSANYVYVDGSPYTMTKTSGDYVSGAVFRYSTTLSAGSHNYYFYFNDGHSHTVTFPTSGTVSGPSVSAPSSDLIVEDIWIQPDPPSSGALTTWWFRIRNQGVGDASGTFYLDCYFDNAYVGHAYVNGLLAGSTYTTYWSAMTWPSDANPHVIKGVVDPDNTIIESNENNNIRSESFQATPPPTYDATIAAHCNREGVDVSVAITKDGSSSGFNTPYTFTGLTGSHTFTVPASDGSGDPFKQWSTGQTTVTLTVSTQGTYTASYETPPPPIYDVVIKAHCNTDDVDLGVAITKDGSSTGYNTPYTFTGLTGTHTFAVPSTDASGHPFINWNTGQTTTTIMVSSTGTYTAYYQATPPSTYSVHLESRQDTSATLNLGTIRFDGIDYSSLPADINKEAKTYSISFTLSGYVFDHWETSGSVVVASSTSWSTTVTVSNPGGTLGAVYRSPLVPTYNVHLESRQDTGATWNYGMIIFGGVGYSLPADVSKVAATYSISYTAASGYQFDHWETSGSMSVANVNSQSTTATVAGAGTYTAYYARALPSSPDFSISAYPESLTIQRGTLGVSTVTVTSVNGFKGLVELAISPQPLGVTASLSPKSVTPQDGVSKTSTLVVMVDETVRSEVHWNLIVTGTSGTLTHDARVLVKINAYSPPVPKILPVPYYYQGDTSWCVPTSMAMVFAYYGQHDPFIHSWDIAKYWGWSTEPLSYQMGGDRMEEYFLNHGLETEYVGYEVGEHLDFDKLKIWIDRGNPILARVMWWESISKFPFTELISHEVVLVGYGYVGGIEIVYVNDPGGTLVNQHPELVHGRTYPFVAVPVEWNEIAGDIGYSMVVKGTPHPLQGTLDLQGDYPPKALVYVRYPENYISQLYIKLYGLDKGLVWESWRTHPIALNARDLFQFSGSIVNQMEQTMVYCVEIEFASVSYTSIRYVECSVGGKSGSGTIMEPIALQQLLEHPGEYTITLGLWNKDRTEKYDEIVLPKISYSAKVEFCCYSPADLWVEDPQGRHVGIDPSTGQVINEIPNAVYTGPGSEPQVIAIPDPLRGSYVVLLRGSATSTYSLTAELLNLNGATAFNATDIPTTSESTHEYEIDWAALSADTEGVTVGVDSDGDGWLDYFFASDSELSRSEYVAATTKHDLGITGTTSSKSITGEGYSLPINMTIMNYGVYTETFNFAFHVNTNLVEPRTVTLASGNSTAMTYTWNTTGLAYGNYTITAYAEPVLGETYVADNNVTWTVHVGVPGDISGPTLGVYDGKVDMRDISYLITHFNPKPSSLDWDQNADINNDAKVNMRDISIAIINFNKHE